MDFFTASEQDDCETIGSTILDSNDDVILVTAVSYIMRRKLTRENGYFKVTIPAYLSGEFENHFQVTREACQLLTQEIMHTGRIPKKIREKHFSEIPPKRVRAKCIPKCSKMFPEFYRSIQFRTGNLGILVQLSAFLFRLSTS